MLKRLASQRRLPAGGRFAIVASRYNSRYVDGLLRNARSELARAGAVVAKLVRVPGAFEIPVVASRLATTRPPFSAILCFGAILRGETPHAQHIAEAVTTALALLQIQHQVPIIHGVFLFENESQAAVRCLGRTHNRGLEAARTALAMADTLRKLES